jgi:hypothetical protein
MPGFTEELTVEFTARDLCDLQNGKNPTEHPVYAWSFIPVLLPILHYITWQPSDRPKCDPAPNPAPQPWRRGDVEVHK